MIKIMIDHINTRTANPSSSLVRNLVGKSGFDQNTRMECHEDADTSTASAVTDTNQDTTADQSTTSASESESSTASEPVTKVNYLRFQISS